MAWSSGNELTQFCTVSTWNCTSLIERCVVFGLAMVKPPNPEETEILVEVMHAFMPSPLCLFLTTQDITNISSSLSCTLTVK